MFIWELFQDAAQEHLEVLKAMSLACLRQSMGPWLWSRGLGRRRSNSADPKKKSSCLQLASTSRRKSSSWKHSQGSSSRLPNNLNNCLTKIQKHIGAVFSKGVKMESKNTQLCRKIKIRLEFSRVFFSQKNQTKKYWMPKKFAVFLKQLRLLFC